MTKILHSFYINGRWVEPCSGNTVIDLIDPATETRYAQLAMGTAKDADRAVAAASAAFPSWSETSRDERIALLERVIELYRARVDELADAVRGEIGAPVTLCKTLQVPIGLAQLQAAVETLRSFQFETQHVKSTVCREPVGVAALITTWNWPLNQIAAKLAPALAAGCTVVLKPSEIAPLDAVLFAQIMHDAGTPPGLFNLVFGEGREVGARLASHPDVDMVSITGSTRTGVDVAIHAAPTVKRITQKLGGKSALLILDDADLQTAVMTGVGQCMANSGQTCIAPTRMLVPAASYARAVEIAAATANAITVGNPADPDTKMGPIASRLHYQRVQQAIRAAIEHGARVVAGGPGRPPSIERGYYARPTVFADVHNGMAVAREEIFGPVLAMIPYEGEEEAVAIANDSEYGLAAYVASADTARARRVAARLRVGTVRINGAMLDIMVPFGGYRRSGNGREYGPAGLAEFIEYKSVTL